MKLIVVQFDDAVDVSVIPKGSTVSINGNSTTLQGGVVRMLVDGLDAPPDLTAHIHPISVTGISGDPIVP